MRRKGLSSSVALLAATLGPPVTAFFPPWVNTPPIGSGLIAAETSATRPPLPPKDDTFGIIGTVRELLAAPDQPKGVERYDGVGLETGGTWRTNALGLLPSTVVAAPLGTAWMAKQEAAGNLVAKWPDSVSQLLGPKSLSNLGTHPDTHASVRKVFAEALSAKAVLELQPIIETALAKRMPRWEKSATSGEPILMLDEINSFTLEAIARCFLGDYAAEHLDEISVLLPALAEGLVSIPRRMPWPLNSLPAFAFGQSMDSRESFREVLYGVLQERKAAMSSNNASGETRRRAGVLDTLLTMQKEQVDTGGAKEGQVVLDDDFVIDNVINALFAGYHTTGVSLTRVLQLLGSPDSKKGLVEQLIKEINRNVDTRSEKLDDGVSNSAVKPAKGIFRAFPLLDAVLLESFRLYPSVAAVMRTTVRDIEYNGYDIPAGTKVQWNLLGAFRAASAYPDPEKFCPFRFLHRGTDDDGDQEVSPSSDYMPTKKDQERPQMFGFGKHMCPGRELAKLEMLLFLRSFLPKFNYDLVERQSFKGKLPTNEPKDKLRVVLKPRTTS